MIQRLARLEREERSLLLRAFLIVCGVRLSLWFLPFKTVARLDSGDARSDAGKVNLRWAHRAAWAVDRASRLVPGASCLTQALSLQRLMSQAGLSSDLRIGVAKQPDARFEAHAWLEHGGVVILGGSESATRFRQLPPLPRCPSKH